MKPKLLLLDEPLSNLDAKLRHELRTEIKRLQKEIGVTTIFVTHDQEEALSMSDRVVVMNGGKIEQISSPTDIYNHPKTEFVFNFIGKSNSFEGRIIAIDNRKISVRIADDVFHVDIDNILGANRTCCVDDEVKLYIRPEKIRLSSRKEAINPSIQMHKATITQMNYLGTSWEIDVAMLGKSLQVLSSAYEPAWQIGSEVQVGWSPSDIMLMKK